MIQLAIHMKHSEPCLHQDQLLRKKSKCINHPGPNSTAQSPPPKDHRRP